MEKYYPLSYEPVPGINVIGGKARSLGLLMNQGFEVPKGVVLTIDFFSGWIFKLKALDKLKAWATNPKLFGELSSLLKREVEKFTFSNMQLGILDSILENYGSEQLFAVRSSSTDEDLGKASFAGGYETYLGVPKDQVCDGIKKVFMSCLDERVFAYKYEKGFDTTQLSMAVIIQEQLDSDVSGVGFSLNPINNCYDETVINANGGLGESVVSGLITPDEYVVDKLGFSVVKQNLGSKKEEIRLSSAGGTEVAKGLGEVPALNEGRVLEVAKLVNEVEGFFGFPVDVEWAYEKGRLYLLQARPVTAYFKVHESMMTEPGEPKLLFADYSLTQGINVPMTTMGLDINKMVHGIILLRMTGKDVVHDNRNGLYAFSGSRMYMNLSTSMKIMGQKRTADGFVTADVGIANILKGLDLSEYKAKKLPKPLKGFIWGTLRRNMGSLRDLLKVAKDSDRCRDEYKAREEAFEEYIDSIVGMKKPVSKLVDEATHRYLDFIDIGMPMFYIAQWAKFRMKRIVKGNKGIAEKVPYLERALPNNITLEMGLKMYELAQSIEFKAQTYESFVQSIREGDCAEAVVESWESFLEDFGFRCPVELDIATPRPIEEPRLVFNQIKRMSGADEINNPNSIYMEAVALREKAYDEILSQLGSGRKRNAFKKNYELFVAFGAFRETPKYWLVKWLHQVRVTLLKMADRLVAEGKLKKAEDIFHLNLSEVDCALQWTREEIYALIDPRQGDYNEMTSVKAFPKVVDSRGRIPRIAGKMTEKGDLQGEPISPGVVTGRVKVLQSPNEKPLMPGEILVTRATDPGWTPLFINAAAILLEVGGTLQHGALVAREYGKPCIVGLVDVVEHLKDGQLVEVDADNGIVRVLVEDKEKSKSKLVEETAVGC